MDEYLLTEEEIDDVRVNTKWTPEAPISQQFRDMCVAAKGQLAADRADMEKVVREIFSEMDEILVPTVPMTCEWEKYYALKSKYLKEEK